MSTILQALKRLEQEQPPRQGGAPNNDPQGFDPRHVLHLSVQRSRWRRRAFVGSAVAVLLLLCGGALLFLRQRPPDEPLIAPSQRQQPTAIATDRSAQRVPAPGVALGANAAPPAFAPDLPDQAPTSSMDGGMAQHRTEMIANGQRRPHLPTTDGAARAASAPIPDALENRFEDAGAVVPGNGSVPFTAPATSAAGTADTNLYAGAAPLQDERLTVQAIVWSANAADRMAVINNRVVREGMVVDGFAVVAIGEGAIYFRESGRLWQVRLGSP